MRQKSGGTVRRYVTKQCLGGYDVRNTTPMDWETRALYVVGLALLVMFTAWLGIATRSIGTLASVWPANAVLLGIFILQPQLAGLSGWLAALVGFVTADLLMEGGFLISLRFTLVNLSFVACALLLVRAVPAHWRSLHLPGSVLTYVTISLIAASCSGLSAALLGYAFEPPPVFATVWDAAGTWFSADVMNAVLILPVVLSAPAFFTRLAVGAHSRRYDDVWEFVPVIVLLASLMLCAGVGGTTSFVIVVSALLWCALSYSVFITSVLTLLTGVWLVVAVSFGLLPFLDDIGSETVRIIALRLCVAVFALLPLCVASISQSRKWSRMKEGEADAGAMV